MLTNVDVKDGRGWNIAVSRARRIAARAREGVALRKAKESQGSRPRKSKESQRAPAPKAKKSQGGRV